MKDREPFRSFFVSYNQNRSVEWVSKQEIMTLALEEKLDWIVYKGLKIEGSELTFLQSYLAMKKEDPTRSPSNTDLAFYMSQFSLEPISRNEVARLRNQVRKKLEIKAGW